MIGITQTVKLVVGLVLEGSVPAMVKVRFTWVRSVKLPFHWTSCLPGTDVANSGCCMAVKRGTGLAKGSFSASWAKATLAQASSSRASKVNAGKRLFILIGL